MSSILMHFQLRPSRYSQRHDVIKASLEYVGCKIYDGKDGL